METKKFVVFKTDNRVIYGDTFAEAVCLGIDMLCNFVIEKQYVDNHEKQILHIWNASLVDGGYLREIFFEDEDIMDWLNEKCQKFNKAFVYVPHNHLLSGNDKRDFFGIDDFSEVKLISAKDLISILASQKDIDYGYGKLGTFHHNHRCSLQKTISIAKNKGYGLVVRNGNRSTIFAWDAEIVDYQKALSLLDDDDVCVSYLNHLKSCGYDNFVVSKALKKDVLPLDIFNGVYFIN